MTARDMDDPLYKEWRNAVFKRDKKRCQMPGCPSPNRKKEAHHIVRWADCPWLRFEVSNGITLCAGCHYSIRNQESAYIMVFARIVEENTP